jgi:hypothetical protein
MPAGCLKRSARYSINSGPRMNDRLGKGRPGDDGEAESLRGRTHAVPLDAPVQEIEAHLVGGERDPLGGKRAVSRLHLLRGEVAHADGPYLLELAHELEDQRAHEDVGPILFEGVKIENCDSSNASEKSYILLRSSVWFI